MAKIRSLGSQEHKQVLSLLERFSGTNRLTRRWNIFEPFMFLFGLSTSFFRWHSSFSPASMWPERQQDSGLVWLSRDGHRRDRWKIDQVIIDPDYHSAYDVGKQLIYYVVNKYGALGVETFLAYVDLHYPEGLTLLKECGFPPLQQAAYVSTGVCFGGTEDKTASISWHGKQSPRMPESSRSFIRRLGTGGAPQSPQIPGRPLPSPYGTLHPALQRGILQALGGQPGKP